MPSTRTVLGALLMVTIAAYFTILHGPNSWNENNRGYSAIRTIVRAKPRRSPVQGQYGSTDSSTENMPTSSSQPHETSVINDLKIDVSCSAWDCSCQVLSDMAGVIHHLWYWGTATREQKLWWHKQQCKTSPSHFFDAGSPPTPLPLLTGAGSTAVDDVCYMILYGGNNNNDEWASYLETWPKRVRGGTSRVYRVLSEAGGKEMGTDGKEAINGSGWVDHTQGIVRLPVRETYNTLAVKSLAMWRYVSRSFVSDGPMER